MIQKVVFLFVLFSLFTSLFSSSAYAQGNVSSAQMLDVGITVSDTRNHELKGTVRLENKGSNGVDDVSLIIQLLSPQQPKEITFGDQKIMRTGESQLIDSLKTEKVNLAPGEKKDVGFMLKYPATIDSTTYQVSVNVVNPSGVSQGSGSESLSLFGSGTFLDIDLETCRIIVAGEDTYQYFEGPNIDKDQTGVASCSVQNNTEKVISARMNLLYAVNSVSQNPDQTHRFPSQPLLTFASGQQQIITFLVPKNREPQVYEGLFQMVDNAGQQVSVNVPFRWIITGPSATIQDISFDKSYYSKGEKANLSISLLASADLSWRGLSRPRNPNIGTDLTKAKVTVTMTDKAGALCGKTTADLPSTVIDQHWNERTVLVSVQRTCLNPKATVRVENDGKTLTQKSVTIVSTPQAIAAANNPVKAALSLPLWIWIVLGVFVLCGSGAGLYFIKKKRSVVAVSIMFGILYGLGLVLPSSSFAQAASSSAKVLAPVNSTDAMLKTLSMQDRYDNRTELWGNVRDFEQNGTGGDSQIKVLPNCERIEITVRGTAGSNSVCTNWAPGLVVMPYIDGVGAKPLEVKSSIGNVLLDPAPTSVANWISVTPGLPGAIPLKDHFVHGPNSFSIHQFNATAGPREATFYITPVGEQKVGNHTLVLKVANSHLVSHGDLGYFTSSFENSTNCNGFGPCYVELKYDYVCRPPLACNAACTNKDDCIGNLEGCTECRPTNSASSSALLNASSSANASGSAAMSCQPPPLACNAVCTSQEQCEGNLEGCNDCRADETGQTKCQKPPLACNAACSTDKDCFGNREGCNLCFQGVCRKPAACNDACTTSRDCETSRDCKSCRPNEAGQNVCQPKFSPDMCGCDGMDFTSAKGDTFFPGDDVTFIAYGKVPKEGWKGSPEEAVESATITSMKLSLYQSTLTNPNQATRIAQSSTITPEIVDTGTGKVRYKVTWNQKIPSTVPSGSLFRVQADIQCSAKPGVLGEKTSATTTNYYADLVRTIQAIGKTKTVLGDATQDNQQAKEFFPGARISEKSCSIMKFYFE